MNRAGLTLLEVLVALAIFLVSLIGIGQLITMGADRARDVQQQAESTRLCQSKLAEVVAGVVPVSSSQSSTPFDEDPNWEWSMDSEQGSVTGLYSITVHVSRSRRDGSRVETALSQMVLDPSLRGSVGNVAASPSSASTSSSSGSSSSSSVPSSTITPPAVGGKSGSAGAPAGSSPSAAGGTSGSAGAASGSSAGASKGGK